MFIVSDMLLIYLIMIHLDLTTIVMICRTSQVRSAHEVNKISLGVLVLSKALENGKPIAAQLKVRMQAMKISGNLAGLNVAQEVQLGCAQSITPSVSTPLACSNPSAEAPQHIKGLASTQVAVRSSPSAQLSKLAPFSCNVHDSAC